MERRHAVAIGIALQTQVLKSCPVHHQIYFDDEADAASAFALAIKLVRERAPYVADFHEDEHSLTDLLSDTLSLTPVSCPACQAAERVAAVGRPAPVSVSNLPDRMTAA
jgi:hypothetical protein